MPEDITFRPTAELMQDDEIISLVEIFAHLGFDKIRLTGGEPTVRAGVVELVRRIRQTPGVNTVSMTTNGILFERLAQPLVEAGLSRVNFSLDTVNPERFQRLTRRGEVEQVYSSILAAEKAGLAPIKINAVMVRDYSDADAVALARLTVEHPWQVRFIEMMPFAGATDFQRSLVVTAEETMAHLEAVFGPLEPVNGAALDGEARLYKIPSASGEIGFISTISQPFCATCTRARLTADGRLRLCLLREDEVDLLSPLRAGVSQAELRRMILWGIWRKPWGNRLAAGEAPLNRTMSEIGG
jgi:cyclic pyranopterin phosphate synthase